MFSFGTWVSPWTPPALRSRRPAASAGQCHAGRQRQIPAAGGDGEAGRQEGAGGGEESLLLLRGHAAACRGE